MGVLKSLTERRSDRREAEAESERTRLEQRIGGIANLTVAQCERLAIENYLDGHDSTHGPTISYYLGEANFFATMAVLRTLQTDVTEAAPVE